ncbi:hypothetical protein XENOCAPTIV_019625 [Xenoophorus captivus]|uniref:Uncharacterized protein n=1 Tax=Xenoophorus captivus TaxID=1517983 RepID=A0ABV0RUM6_9TELE
MEYLLQVKIGALIGLLLLTLLFGFIPAKVKWFRDTNGTEAHRIVLSLISCFAGGVFLAACLLDIIPDYLSDISAQLDAQKLEVLPTSTKTKSNKSIFKFIFYFTRVGIHY